MQYATGETILTSSSANLASYPYQSETLLASSASSGNISYPGAYPGQLMRVASGASLPPGTCMTPGSPATYSRAVSTSVAKERQVGTLLERDYSIPRAAYIDRTSGSFAAPVKVPTMSGSLTAPMQYVERLIEAPAPIVEYVGPQRVVEAPVVEYVGGAPVVVETPVMAPTVEVVGGNGDIRQLAMQLATERQQRQHLEGQLASVMAQMNTIMLELSSCKARLDKIDPPVADTPLRAATRIVEQRGNVVVNHSSGHVNIIRPLKFEPRTTKEKPTAVFQDISIAEAVCKDLAELSNIFNCPMTIEGHTKGGESQFWQQLADNRARVVTELMIEYGANRNLLRAQGKPGRLGKNEVRTEVFMDISNIQDERAPVVEVDIVQNGPNGVVVERDLYQAGHLVERDRSKSGPVVERDVAIGGLVVEKDFYRRNTQERELVGLGGKSVEHDRVDSTSVAVARPAAIVRSSSPIAVSRAMY